MNLFIETFKKQGGIKLLKEYWRAGVSAYAFGQLILTKRFDKTVRKPPL